MSTVTKILKDVEIGSTFKVAGKEFIKIEDADGKSTVVSKKIAFKSAFGNNNNFSESNVWKKLNDKLLPEIITAVGDENICEFETDLISLDGLKTYGKITSKISIPTFDFYRKNVEIFDRHKVDNWWWLATPYSAEPHWKDCLWAECVTPSGGINGNYYDNNYGVRPVLIFVSEISVSCEE